MLKRIKEYFWLKSINSKLNKSIEPLSLIIKERFIDFETKKALKSNYSIWQKTRYAVFTKEQIEGLKQWNIDVPLMIINVLLKDIGDTISSEAKVYLDDASAASKVVVYIPENDIIQHICIYKKDKDTEYTLKVDYAYMLMLNRL